MSATVVYVHWRDAAHGLEEIPVAQAGELADLHEVGFLVAENDESITLSPEHQDGATSARLWLTIPRVNIIEMRKVSMVDLLRWMRRRIVQG